MRERGTGAPCSQSDGRGDKVLTEEVCLCCCLHHNGEVGWGGGVGKADPASRRGSALNETLMKHPCLEESGGGRGGGDGRQKKKNMSEWEKRSRFVLQAHFVNLSLHFYIC